MGKEELNTKTPLAPIDRTKDLCCPLLGLFGNEDRAPSREQVNKHKPSSKSTARRTSSTATTVRPRFLLLAPAALSARPGNGWLEQGIRLLRQASGEVGVRTVHRRDRTRGRHGEAWGRMVPAIAGGGRL